MDPTAYEVVHELEESHWFFVGRRRILSRLLDEILQGEKQLTILDVGCGTGTTMRLLGRYGEVTGIDISAKAIRYCREQGRLRLCQADSSCLPFSDESFDLVTALDLLEHLQDESRGLVEFWRVLKEGGRMLLFVPAFMFLWSDFDRFSGHHRRYTKEELKQKVEQSGLEVIRLSYFNAILFPIVWAVRVVKNFVGRWRSFRSDLETPSMGLSSILAEILSLESNLIARGDLPFGVSLVCIARKGCPE